MPPHELEWKPSYGSGSLHRTNPHLKVPPSLALNPIDRFCKTTSAMVAEVR